jgi:hypothetical protein
LAFDRIDEDTWLYSITQGKGDDVKGQPNEVTLISWRWHKPKMKSKLTVMKEARIYQMGIHPSKPGFISVIGKEVFKCF